MAALPATHARQGRIGLGLAALIAGSWLAIHFMAMAWVPVRWDTAWLVAGIALVQCWLSVGVFIVAHDAMHGSLAPGRPRLNALFGGALLWLYAGFGWRRMRDAHFAHHRAPGTAADPDFDAEHPGDFGRWYLTFLKRYFGASSLLWVGGVVTLYTLLLRVPVENVVLMYGLPAIASSLQLFYFGTFRPHRHGDDAFADHHNARSEGFSPALSLATCFHFGYHREHHLRPNVPWWGLPAARAALAEPNA